MPWLWTYLANILIVVRGTQLVAALNHFWTLAVEEHFYLFWPLVVFLLGRRSLMRACGAVVLIAVAARVAMVQAGYGGWRVHVFTPCRMDAFAIGGWLSVAIRGPEVARLTAFARRAFAPALLGAFVVFSFGGEFGEQRIGYTLYAAAFGLLIVGSISALRPGGGSARLPLVAKAFRTRAMRTLGKYSYALYVFHHPINVVAERVVPTPRLADRLGSLLLATIVHGASVFAVSLAVAMASWYLFERHFLRLKRFVPLAEKNAGPERKPATLQGTAEAASAV
jgi:peptidoglycan/LPS O-acetylase OafA/YrhL